MRALSRRENVCWRRKETKLGWKKRGQKSALSVKEPYRPAGKCSLQLLLEGPSEAEADRRAPAVQKHSKQFSQSAAAPGLPVDASVEQAHCWLCGGLPSQDYTWQVWWENASCYPVPQRPLQVWNLRCDWFHSTNRLEQEWGIITATRFGLQASASGNTAYSRLVLRIDGKIIPLVASTSLPSSNYSQTPITVELQTTIPFVKRD